MSFYENKPTGKFGIRVVSAPFVVAVRWVLVMVRLTRGQVVDEASADIDLAENVEKAQINVVHWQNQEGNTALLLAAGWGRLSIVAWLAETAGLDIDHANVMGDRALHRAANWGREDVVKYLLTYRARSNMSNKKGMLYADALDQFRRHNEAF